VVGIHTPRRPPSRIESETTLLKPGWQNEADCFLKKRVGVPTGSTGFSRKMSVVMNFQLIFLFRLLEELNPEPFDRDDMTDGQTDRRTDGQTVNRYKLRSTGSKKPVQKNSQFFCVG
jgi:hypothetical protein